MQAQASCRLFALLLLPAIIFSCSAPKATPDATPQQAETPAIDIDSSAQIGEYVVSLFEDKAGILWFGTMQGVVRFDGKNVARFTVKEGLPDNVVAGIAQDSAGNMWFGTHNGAARYDGKSFTVFGEDKGLRGAGCKFLVDKNGAIWAGTNHGVFRFNGFSFVSFVLPEPQIENLTYKWEAGKVWDLIQDSKGNIWFARDGYGACRYDSKNFTHYTKKDGLLSNNVSGIVEDSKGNLWFACLSSDLPSVVLEGGVCKYDGTTFTSFPNEKGLTKNDIYSVYCEKAGNVWIGATGVGAYRYDGASFAMFENSDRDDLITTFGVQAIFEDSKGNLWFGFSGGLFRFDGRTFVNITQGRLFG